MLPALIQAIRRDRAVDHAFSVVTLVLLSVPDFLLATMLLIAFVVMIAAASGDLAGRLQLDGLANTCTR